MKADQTTRSAERGTRNAKIEDGLSNPATGRLPVRVVEHLHRLLGGDARVEGFILRFISHQYRAKNLFYLEPDVAREICRKPADFIRTAKEYCEPELKF